MRKIVVKKNGKGDFAFEADDPKLPGSPPVGRGSSIQHALGDWLIQHQASLGLLIDVDPSVYHLDPADFGPAEPQDNKAKYPDDGGLKDPLKTFEDASEIIKMVLKTFAK